MKRAVDGLHKAASYSGLKGSAMTPLTITISLIEVVLIPVAGNYHDNWVGKFCAALATCALAYYIWKYEYWARHDPDRLQSESFNIIRQEQILSVTPDKNGEEKIILQSSGKIGASETNQHTD